MSSKKKIVDKQKTEKCVQFSVIYTPESFDEMPLLSRCLKLDKESYKDALLRYDIQPETVDWIFEGWVKDKTYFIQNAFNAVMDETEDDSDETLH